MLKMVLLGAPIELRIRRFNKCYFAPTGEMQVLPNLLDVCLHVEALEICPILIQLVPF